MSLAALGRYCSGELHASRAPNRKNIVLNHGAFVDGSGWRTAYDILVRDGYTVSVVQQPLTGLSDDVAATKRILERSTQ